MKPRLLFTAFDVVPAPKGASVRIQETLKALSADFDVCAVLLGEPGYLLQEDLSGVQVERLIAPEPHFLEKTVIFAEKVIQKIEDWQPDIVHFRSLWDGFPVSQYFKNKATRPYFIYELHGLPEYELEHHYPFLPDTLIEKVKAQQTQLIQAVDAFICPSHQHVRYLESVGIALEKVHMIGNGVDLTQFYPCPERKEKGLILYLGTLAPWQGLESLIESLAQLKLPYQARLIGKGNARWQRDLITKAYQEGVSHAFEIMNPMAHEFMPTLIQSAQIAVAPLNTSARNCIQGCNPIKIYEYMACGKPVVAPDLPVVRDILTHDHDALLYPPDDTQALAKALDSLLEDPEKAQTLGNNGYEKVKSQFSWANQHQKMQRFYCDFRTIQKF